MKSVFLKKIKSSLLMVHEKNYPKVDVGSEDRTGDGGESPRHHGV